MGSPSGRYYASLERYEHIEWRNGTKILKHPRDKEDWIRLLIHIPWGLLAVGLFLVDPLLGFTACLGTLIYEAFNDWRKKDDSYKDVLGIVWGFLIGGYVLLILLIYDIIKI